MSETVSEAAPELPPECGRELMIAVIAASKQLGSVAMMVVDDEEDDVAMIRLARIGPRLLLAERPGDLARSRPRRFTAYVADEIEPDRPVRLDPDAALFVVSEQGFWTPPDFALHVLVDPRLWFNRTMLALYAVLTPLLPAA